MDDMCVKHSVPNAWSPIKLIAASRHGNSCVTLYLTNWGIVSSSLLSTFFPFPHLLMSSYPSVATSTPIAQLPPTPQSTPRNSSSCSGLSVANALSFSANSNLMNYSLPKSESKVCVQKGSIVVKHCPSNKKI